MRSLKDAGLNQLPPFIKQPQLDGRVFEILDAVARDSQFGAEVVFTLRCLDDASAGPWMYDQDGEAVHVVSWSAAALGGRNNYVKHFALSGAETLGPCAIEWIANGTANAFAKIVDADWVDADAAPPPAAAPALPRPSTRPAAATVPNGGGASATRSRRAAPVSADGRQAFRPDDADGDLDELPF